MATLELMLRCGATLCRNGGSIAIVSGYGLHVLLAVAQEVPVAWPSYETSWSHSETL